MLYIFAFYIIVAYSCVLVSIFFIFNTSSFLFCKYLCEGHWFFSCYCCVLPSINKGPIVYYASKTLFSLSVPIPGKEKFMLAYIVQETKHKQNKHELTRQDSLPSRSSLSVHLATLPIQSTDF